jgi:hypothetical protein
MSLDNLSFDNGIAAELRSETRQSTICRFEITPWILDEERALILSDIDTADLQPKLDDATFELTRLESQSDEP